VTIAGTRDGSWMAATGIEPYLAWSDPVPAPPHVFLLGVAHRSCLVGARRQLQPGSVALPDGLSSVLVEESSGEEMRLDNLGLPPAPAPAPTAARSPHLRSTSGLGGFLASSGIATASASEQSAVTRPSTSSRSRRTESAPVATTRGCRFLRKTAGLCWRR
jgi:hypothetical protein